MSTSNLKIKWGIIGCGNIAGKFARDLALVTEAELTAVASRNKEKAKQFKIDHQAKKHYGNYNELLADPDIDIIYIATPHVSHAKWSILAMEQGKHVLCEKPLSINKKEAEEIIAASKRTGKFFMEALWTRFNPTFIAVKELIEKGDLGAIKYIQADFTFKSDKPLESRVLDLALGGGTILDIGIYPAFLSYSLMGIPEKILAGAVFHKITGCDMQSSMIFKYNTAQAVLYSSFETDSGISAKIGGTEGTIHFHGSFHVPDGYTLIKNGVETNFKIPFKGLGFTHEIEECHTCIRKGQKESKKWSHRDSLNLIGILDQVRAEVGLTYPQEKQH
ncbi:MAG: gfo/Idh/MocA family oxidoreductase [Flavobacteriia bacterium]|nr:MAG: gfo/Idh/MocA family oxidoreductase [Flavobacteriia bacterium]